MADKTNSVLSSLSFGLFTVFDVKVNIINIIEVCWKRMEHQNVYPPILISSRQLICGRSTGVSELWLALYAHGI